MRYPIGTQFYRYGRKHPQLETVIDFLTTTNLAGEVVKVRYVTSHEFLGRSVVDSDVLETTIARSIKGN